MNTKEYLEYVVKEIHTVIVATVDDDGLPVTSAIDMMDADEGGLYFLTAKGKGFYDRLKKREFLALTATKGDDTMNSVAISIRGKVRDLGFEKIPELFEKNPPRFGMIIEHLSSRLRKLTDKYLAACSLVYEVSEERANDPRLSEDLKAKLKDYKAQLYD